jgi:taurine dioxygenase
MAEFAGMRTQGKEGQLESHVHPLVHVHPETGRRSLFISTPYCHRLEDMTEEESRPLLDQLASHATRAEFTCRFRWRERSLAVWDNRCTMHVALDDDIAARTRGQGFRRVMHRATIAN